MLSENKKVLLDFRLEQANDCLKEAGIMIEVFRSETKTKSALHTTFVTTYGLVQNELSANVQSVITMEDLFSSSDH